VRRRGSAILTRAREGRAQRLELLRQDPHSGSDHFLAGQRGDGNGMTRPSPEGL
jgi:hypothetical protein